MKDFISSIVDELVMSCLVNGKPLWLCGLDENGSDGVSEKSSTGYIAKPFLEHEIEPFGWHDILTTLDVCSKKVHATWHCNEEGYDIMSLNMVTTFKEGTESSYSSGSL